ncbi:MAG: hypothetical protein KatS3mg061_1874 [Dehalococcoidia bacterium]|nr:MAG: hypothetical protein KatS3mg061_1874 [Dehalococcoidia bacterium]
MPWSGRRRPHERGNGMVLVHPDVIREWVEAHGGKPGHLANTFVGDEVGILRIWFPGHTFARFVPLPWDRFLAKMKEKGLALYCEEDPRTGRPYTRVVPAPPLR